MSAREAKEPQFDEVELLDVSEPAPAESDLDLTPAGMVAPAPPAPIEPIAAHAAGGPGLSIAGFAIAVVGAALGAAALTGMQPPAGLGAFGAIPLGVCALGIGMVLVGGLRRRVDIATERADAIAASFRPVLEYLTARAELTVDRIDVDRLGAAMQRLDEKISNLSRATKMYGKPLVDVANRVQHTADALREIEQSLDGVVEKVESSSERLLAEIAKLPDAASATGVTRDQFEALMAATQKSAGTIEELKVDFETTPSTLEPLATVQRAIEQMQREVAEIATTIVQLQQQPAPAPERAPERVFAGVAATAAPVESFAEARTSARAAPSPAAKAEPAPAPAPAQAPTQPAQGGPKGALVNSIAGERKSTGKNVLGAIAKLKQMRS